MSGREEGTVSESVRQRLEADLRAAMRAGDHARRDTVRYILAAIKNAEIDRRGPLSGTEETAILRKLGKQLGDSIDQFRAGSRTDLADREAAQLTIVQEYLPTELSDEELNAIVDQVIDDLGASGMKEMGRVMPVLIERVAGRADGRRLSGAVRSALSARQAT